MTSRPVDCLAELISYTLYAVRLLKAEEISCKDLSERYGMLLRRADRCAKEAGFSDEEWREALFPACAWIDESILCSDWAGKEEWQRNPLQLIYFNTINAGEEFFARLAALGEHDDPIREVYDYCLMLGFKGRFYLAEDEGRLANLTRSQLSSLTANPELETPEELFPMAYSGEAKPKRRKRWARSITFVNLLFVLSPVAAFAILYFFYRQALDKMVTSYFG